MTRYFIIGILLSSFISELALSASDSEYLKIIESNGATILETYRIPEGADLSYWGTDRDTYFYKGLDSDLEEKAPFWTKGYFNDDEIPDYLYIMFHRAKNEAFLIGLISSANGYESIVIEPSGKTMAIETKNNIAGHYHLEGHGHGLKWNKNEAKFDAIR